MIKRLSGIFSGESYQARAMRGSFLTIVNFGGHNVLRLGSNLILTRLLFPEAFGLMALVQVVLAGTAMFSDFGIRGSIIQNPRGDDPVFLNTAWTFQILRGFLLGLGVLVVAGPLASFYDQPQLLNLLYFAAIIPVVQGFTSTRTASQGRHLALGRLTMLALSTQAFGIIVMIVLAWQLNSVWALMFGNAAATILQVVLTHIVLPGKHRNGFAFERAAVRDLVGFGKYVFIATLAEFFIRHGDRAVLGKFLTLEGLAIYNIGFFLATVPQKFAGRLSNMVIFPLYSRRPPWESERNRSKINRARLLLTAGLVAGTALLAVIGDFMVKLLYDPRYEGGGPILVLIAIMALPQLTTLSYERLPLSAGKSGRYAFFMISRALLLLGITIIGVANYGVIGAIIAPLIAWVLIYPVLIWTILPFKGWDPVHDIFYTILVTGVMAALLWYHWETIQPLLPAP